MHGQSIEREFGVPIPGTVVEPSRWTKTALKRLPPPHAALWPDVFGRRAPLIVDVGCGNGRFLLASALARPECDHVGIDILPLVLRYATRRANQRGLSNLRFAAIDGERFVAEYLPAQSVHELHSYHPQPYHDPRQARRRLWQPAFLAQVHRALEPGGRFVAQTDNAPYWEYLLRCAPAFFDFRVEHERWPDAPRGRTRREILALRRRLPIFRGWGTPRPDVTPDQYAVLIDRLPGPQFDAGPPRHDLDELEARSR